VQSIAQFKPPANQWLATGRQVCYTANRDRTG
jgi:hypothetical protein